MYTEGSLKILEDDHGNYDILTGDSGSLENVLDINKILEIVWRLHLVTDLIRVVGNTYLDSP